MSPDSISMRVGLSTTLLSLSMDSVRAIDVSHGRFASFGSVARDGAIGLALGVGFVVLTGAVVCSHSFDEFCGVNTALIAVPVGVLGMVSGIVIAEKHKKEQWERIYERSQTASLLIGPTPRGFAVGLSIPLDIDIAVQP